jgi:hypothetical protein
MMRPHSVPAMEFPRAGLVPQGLGMRLGPGGRYILVSAKASHHVRF